MNIQKIFWVIRGIVYKIKFAKFGNFSYIGKPVFLEGTKNITIARRVRIFPGARMQCIGKGRIYIGENTSIAQNLHITAMQETLAIGKGVTILGNVCITNIDHEYQQIDVPILEQKMSYNKTEIGDNCCIGYGACIQAGTILGKQCIVGAGAVVRGTFQDYSVIVGVPAKVVKKYNANTQKWERINSYGE